MFLRHRLQKGLLNRLAPPKEEDMKSMSEFLGKLETFPDLEAEIIKSTKINKVLKAILKLDPIPKEEEFKFKTRSQTLLDTWTKTLNAADTSTPTPAAPTNGVNGSGSGEVKPDATNGADEAGTGEVNGKEELPAKTEAPETETTPKAEEETKEKPLIDTAKGKTEEVGH